MTLPPARGLAPSQLPFSFLCRQRGAVRVGQEHPRLPGHRSPGRPVFPLEGKAVRGGLRARTARSPPPPRRRRCPAWSWAGARAMGPTPRPRSRPPLTALLWLRPVVAGSRRGARHQLLAALGSVLGPGPRSLGAPGEASGEAGHGRVERGPTKDGQELAVVLGPHAGACAQGV